MTERELFFRYLGLPSSQPLGLEINFAQGIWLYSPDGKKYMDLVSGISVSNIGHRHPVVISAIKEQVDKYLYLSVYGELIQAPQTRLAKKLSENLPAGLSSVYFVNSGSEAVEGAMKLSKRFTGRTEIIAFRHAYHGSTQGSLSVLGEESLKQAFRPLLPDVKFLDFNNFDDLEKITERTACVITETIQSEAGVVLPVNGYLAGLRKRCSEKGALLVIDDIQMGFGRTGKLFSFQHFGITPDILVLAKAMGGGMPIGAFISSQEIMSSLTHDPELGHITTFGGHAVNCSAAYASLEVLTSGKLLSDVERRGSFFEKKISSHPAIAGIRRKGLMIGADLKDPSKRKKMSENAIKNGIIIDWFLFREATFRIAPPLTITDPEMVYAGEFLLKSLDGL